MSFLRLASVSAAAILAVPLAGGCSASSDEGVGGNSGSGNVGGFGAFGSGGTNTGGFGAFGSGGTNTGGFGTGGIPGTGGAATGGAAGSAGTGAFGATGGSAGSSGSGGTAATGGVATGGSAGTGGVATGGTAGSGGVATGGTGTGGIATGGTPGTGGVATGGTAGTGGVATGGTAGTGGVATGGTGGVAGCPGTTIGSTCYYMADKNGQSYAAARSKCTTLGAGWDLCSSSQLCNASVYTYLGTAGCDCNGGVTACACGSAKNLYIQVVDSPSAPYYIRTANAPNCNWASDACTVSVSETCGAALCCK